MLKGLGIFADSFARHPESYIVIGGTACYLNLQAAGLDFRATKDIDMVLTLEALTPDFFKAFWDFIHGGKYAIRQRGDGTPVYYRFSKPEHPDYPPLVELFSRDPAINGSEAKNHIARIPAGDDISGLSAILLDSGYDAFLREETITLQGVTVATIDTLVALKAKAWLDQSERRMQGLQVDSNDIRKHLNDIITLVRTFVPGARRQIPESVMKDIALFIEHALDTSPGHEETRNDIENHYCIRSGES